MNLKLLFGILCLFLLTNLLAFDQYLKTGIKGGTLVINGNNNENYRIDHTLWIPDESNNNKNVIIYNHGMQSHRAWENETFEELRNRGFTIFAFDRIGSGTSEGEWNKKHTKRLMGHIKDWNTYLVTLKQVIDKMEKLFPDSDLHLWANSYGAKIVTAYLLKNNDTRIVSTVFTTPGLYRNTKSMPLPQDYNQMIWDKFGVIIGKIPLIPEFEMISDDKYFPSTITEKNDDNGAHWFTSMDPYFDLIKDDQKSVRDVTKSFLMETKEMDGYIADKDSKKGNTLNGTKRLYCIVNGDPMMDNNQLALHINRNPVGAELKAYDGGDDHRHFLPFTQNAEEVLDDITYFLLKR